MNVLIRLQTKECIECCLLRPLCAHPPEMASVSAQRLYDLERALCTYDHTVLLNNPTYYYHLLERWRRRFGIFIIGVNLLNLPNLPSCQVYPLLHYPYDLNISTSKCMEAQFRAPLLDPKAHQACMVGHECASSPSVELPTLGAPPRPSCAHWRLWPLHTTRRECPRPISCVTHEEQQGQHQHHSQPSKQSLKTHSTCLRHIGHQGAPGGMYGCQEVTTVWLHTG